MVRWSLNKRYNLLFTILLSTLFATFSENAKAQRASSYTYEVRRLKQQMSVDADWNKRQWKKANTLDIANFLPRGPVKFRPQTQARMMYDKSNIYIIFRVEDQFVKSVLTDYNAAVYQDACVEFFFSPDLKFPRRYFHIETNTSGNPFFAYDSVMRKDILFTLEDLKQVKVACSLPAKIDPEITEPVTWTIEYKIPLSILRNYADITQPKRGIKWTGNFYKTASKTSNPHWVSWSPVNMPNANFHQPDFFGTLVFK